MSAGRPIVTSTPNQGPSETTVLREKKWNKIFKGGERSAFQEEKIKIRTDKFKSKENRRRHPPRANKQSSAVRNENDPMVKRRNQAIEAMQIAELRRRRMADEEKLAETFDKLKVVPSEFLPDGRLRLSRQQLITRNLKRKRVEQQLREQATRKEQANRKKNVTFKEPILWTPRPTFVVNETRPKTFQYVQEVKKAAAAQPSTSANALEKKATTSTEHETDTATAAAAEKKEEECKSAKVDAKTEEKKKIIRYTKDELRELNPLGYYCL
jgi:hypothetical protein